MISITPQGVGVVEAAVTVAFTAFGASATAGMAIGLVYRGIVFWMPFIIGAILIQTTKTFRPTKNKSKSNTSKAGNFNYERKKAALSKEAHKKHDVQNEHRPHLPTNPISSDKKVALETQQAPTQEENSKEADLAH